MRLSQIIFLLVFIAIILSVDIFLYRWIKSLKLKYEKSIKIFLLVLFRISPVVFVCLFLVFPLMTSFIPAEEYMSYVHSMTGMFFLIYLPKIELIFFIAIENLILSLFKAYNWIIRHKKLNMEIVKRRLSIINKFGFAFATLFFFLIVYGINYGKFDFIVRSVEIRSESIPKEFDGLKIVHITDLHLGGFWGYEEEVEKIVKLINQQEPDLFVFTGDFVNNVSGEIDGFVHHLINIKSKLGSYSILGNHDYGDYIRWENPEQKYKNLERLIHLQDSIGFKMLLNESVKIGIENDTINLIGVENWGHPPFPKYGNLTKATSNIDQNKFDILLSHDPTHWEAEVLNKTKIDLTLSGHTHGAQFGLEIDGIRWSPVSIRYDHWGGLYEKSNQKLYVSTGVGFIGFPGRIGMPPEIVVYKLVRK